MGERLRRSGLVAGCLVALFAMAGCTFPEPYPEIPRHAPSGGQTQAELEAKLATIPGLIFERASGSEPNIKGNTAFSYEFALDPAYRITDPDRLFNYLIESAWSVRDAYQPNTTVEIYLLGVPEDGLDLDLVGEETGWVPIDSQARRGVATDGYTHVSVWLDPDSFQAEERGGIANRERLGPWPGDAPEVPVGVTELRTDVDSNDLGASPSAAPEPSASPSSGER